MSKSEEACLYLQQLEGVEKQLDCVPAKVTSVEAASAEAAVQSKEELAYLQKECDLSRQSTATAESSVTVLHK